MLIHNKTRRDKIQALADMARRGNYEELIHTMGYLTGIYSAYYAVAILDSLSEADKDKFKTALSLYCDPIKVEEISK